MERSSSTKPRATWRQIARSGYGIGAAVVAIGAAAAAAGAAPTDLVPWHQHRSPVAVPEPAAIPTATSAQEGLHNGAATTTTGPADGPADGELDAAAAAPTQAASPHSSDVTTTADPAPDEPEPDVPAPSGPTPSGPGATAPTTTEAVAAPPTPAPALETSTPASPTVLPTTTAPAEPATSPASVPPDSSAASPPAEPEPTQPTQPPPIDPATTAASPTTVHPDNSVPGGITLSCTSSAQSVSCEWSGPTPSGFDRYLVLRGNGGAVGRVPFASSDPSAHSFTDIAVPAGTYSYLVIAVDAASAPLVHSNSVPITITG